MHHPIPRFADVPIAPIPDRLPRFHEAEQAIIARMSDPRPPELDSHIGWFPKASEKHHNTQSGGREQKRSRKKKS